MAARDPEDRRRYGTLGAHTQWSRERDRTARTAGARRAFLDRFEREVDPEGTLPADVRAKMAANAKRAYFLRLALKSAKARAAKKGGGDAKAS
jgi:hypothetical protein